VEQEDEDALEEEELDELEELELELLLDELLLEELDDVPDPLSPPQAASNSMPPIAPAIARCEIRSLPEISIVISRHLFLNRAAGSRPRWPRPPLLCPKI
jgi:hypothetical protein